MDADVDGNKKVEFSREYPKTDSREIWADGGKWHEFFTVVQEAKKEGATTLVVSAPEVLGDTWRELILNLSTIAAAGLTLEIQPPTDYDVVRSELEFGSGEAKEVLKGLVLERKGAPQDPGSPKKRGPFILKHGNKPSIDLLSTGPDEVYCQAELLMKRDWEEYKATSKNREILGSYEITAGTVEWFLHQHQDRPSQTVLEDYRMKLLKDGWDFYHIPYEESARLDKAKRALKGALKQDPFLLDSEKTKLEGLQKRLDNFGK